MSETLHRSEPRSYEPLHLRDYWNVVLRRRGLALFVFLLVVAAGAARLVFVQPAYQATAQVLIERDIPNILDFEKNARAADVWDSFYQTQYRLLQSRLLARRVVEKLKLQDDPEFEGPRPEGERELDANAPPGASVALERVIDQFLDRLRVQPVKNSQLVAVSFQARQPLLAADAVNALVDAYIQQTLEFRYRVSAEAGAWLVNETQEQSRKVEAASLALQKFQEQEGLANVEARRPLLEQKLKDLGSALNTAKTRRLEKEATYEEMRSVTNVEELPDVLRSPLIQTLRTELALLERQGAQLEAKGYLQEHPEAVRLRSQIEGTRQKIALEARRIVRAAQNEYQVAVSQEAGVAAALEAAKAEAQDLARRSVKYDALKRDLEASKVLSENILTRQKQTDVARDLQASNVHVIDPAIVPRTPTTPRPVRDLGLAMLLGLGCALAAAFFRDYLDTSVGRPADVRLLGLPLLGVIPETRARLFPALVGERGRESFAEGYRVLRTALHSREVEQGQMLLVTSTLPGEGKSLTALNLALSLAQTEERVLLVDADLRRPSLHTLLRARRVPGLSDVLTDGVEPAKAVQCIAGTRLSLLAGGAPVPVSSTDLLARSVLRDLLAQLRTRYDRIVVDSPPAGTIADALVLAPLVDGVLVVARSGKVGRGAIVHLLDRLYNAGGNVLGVVLNRAHPDRDRYDYGPPLASDPFPGAPVRSLALSREVRPPHSPRRPS